MKFSEIKERFRPPSTPEHKNFTFALRECSTVQEGFKTNVWLFGERPLKKGFSSVAIKVVGFKFHSYVDLFDVRSENLMEVAQALVESLNEGQKYPRVQDYEIVYRRRFVGFDYEALKYREDMARPMLKLYTNTPRQAPPPLYKFRDHRNVERELHVYNGDHKLENLFLYEHQIALQDLVEVDEKHLKPVSKKNTTCQEEYVLFYQKKPAIHSTHQTQNAYLVCATRLRLFNPKSTPALAKKPSHPCESEDELTAISSVLYWVGYECAPVILNFYVGKKGVQNGDLCHAFGNSRDMIRVWLKAINELDVDVFLTLNDLWSDIHHLVVRAENNNLGKVLSAGNVMFKNTYKTPGRDNVFFEKTMEKMQVRPPFDEFTLPALLAHPKVLNGTENIDSHQPLSSKLLPSEQVVQECSKEAQMLHDAEQKANIVKQHAASSNIVYTSITKVSNAGQQIRVFNRLLYTVFNQMVINPEQVKRLVTVLDAKKYNSFVDPPELPNTPLDQRDSSYAEKIYEAIKNEDVSRLAACKLKTPPTIQELFPGFEPPVEVKRKTKSNNLMDLLRQSGTKKETKAKRIKLGGGLVHKPIPGFYRESHQKIAVLDFASLYPSIFQGYRPCYSNLIYDDEALREMQKNPRFELMYVNIHENDSVAFVLSIDGKPLQTVFPEMEVVLVQARRNVKNQMKTLDKIKDKNELVNLDKKQLELKITCNAAYGFTGADQEKGMLPCDAIMATITAIGRWMNKMSVWYVIRYYLAVIIYGDTDSIMPMFPGDRSVKEFWDFNEQVARELSDLYKNPNKMEMEGIYWPMFMTDRKKNYVRLAYEGPDDTPAYKVTGLPYIKRDRCHWVRETCSEIMKMLLYSKDELVIPYLQSQLSDLVNSKVSLENLAVTCAIKDFEEYKGESLIQLEVAKKIEQRSGRRPEPGSRISILQTKGKGQKYLLGETLEYMESHPEVELDKEHYMTQLESILELLFMHSDFKWKSCVTSARNQMNQSKSLKTFLSV